MNRCSAGSAWKFRVLCAAVLLESTLRCCGNAPHVAASSLPRGSRSGETRVCALSLLQLAGRLKRLTCSTKVKREEERRGFKFWEFNFKLNKGMLFFFIIYSLVYLSVTLKLNNTTLNFHSLPGVACFVISFIGVFTILLHN